jgi:crotonobetainyl-CoA:carnitine CoA-transferase CaiB-like acyl-CoA transferase
MRHAPPSIGQDTEALLRELGYDSAHIQRMVQDGVVKVITPPQA